DHVRHVRHGHLQGLGPPGRRRAREGDVRAAAHRRAARGRRGRVVFRERRVELLHRRDAASRRRRAGIRIHGYLISTWTRTACMTCLEKGGAYELVPVARGEPEHFAMHPFARMPVLEADGQLIPEGLAVMGYLDETLPGPALLPSDPLARARVRTWMSV